jgi:hypothetical protein
LPAIYSCSNNSNVLKPVVKDEIIIFNNTEDTLYLKTVVWGISGNHHKTFLSSYKKNDTQYDTIRDYIFKEDYPIYYSKTKDTLLIYVMDEPQTPNNFSSNVIVKQIKIDGKRFRELCVDYEKKKVYKIDFP